MKKILLIKPTNEIAKKFYINHQTYHDGDSGLDLFILEDITISLGQTLFVDLGIQCEMLEECNNSSHNNYKNVSYYMYPRSSFSKHPLILGNHQGIIDAGYRGNIKAAIKYLPHDNEIHKIIDLLLDFDNSEKKNIMDNLPKYTIRAGTRLFQICSNNLEPFNFKVVDVLSNTSRGDGGFGSTDK